MTELKISIISDKFWERIKVNWESNHESLTPVLAKKEFHKNELST